MKFSPIIIIVFTALIISMLSGGTLVIAGFFGSSGNLEKGLVGHWKLDLESAKSDTVTADKTPNSNNGTLSGGQTYTNDSTTDRKGQSDGALNLDGAGDYISVDGLITTLAQDTRGTISFWTKIDIDDGNQNIIFSISIDGGAARTEFIIDFDMRSAGDRLVALLKTDGTMQWQTIPSPIDGLLTPHVGQWVHVAVTQDAVSPKLYLNGLDITDFEVETDKTKWFKAILTDATSDADTANIGLLELNGSNLVPFDGQIDDFRIYDRALTQAEITRLFDSYNPATKISSLSKGLIGYWPLDLGAAKSDTITADKTPYSNNGTLTGGQTYTNDSTTDRRGQADKALNFNGTTDYVNLGSGITVSNITVAMWIKTNELPFSEWKHLLGMFDGDRPVELEGFTAQSNFRWHITTSGGPESLTTSNLPDTGWHHVVATYDGTTMAFYIDGVFDVSDPHDFGGAIVGLPDEMWIGNRPDLVFGSWNGKIDDVRIYDRALNTTEITRLFDSYY